VQRGLRVTGFGFRDSTRALTDDNLDGSGLVPCPCLAPHPGALPRPPSCPGALPLSRALPWCPAPAWCPAPTTCLSWCPAPVSRPAPTLVPCPGALPLPRRPAELTCPALAPCPCLAPCPGALPLPWCPAPTPCGTDLHRLEVGDAVANHDDLQSVARVGHAVVECMCVWSILQSGRTPVMAN
jgi:hypothetical protein